MDKSDARTFNPAIIGTTSPATTPNSNISVVTTSENISHLYGLAIKRNDLIAILEQVPENADVKSITFNFKNDSDDGPTNVITVRYSEEKYLKKTESEASTHVR